MIIWVLESSSGIICGIFCRCLLYIVTESNCAESPSKGYRILGQPKFSPKIILYYI